MVDVGEETGKLPDMLLRLPMCTMMRSDNRSCGPHVDARALMIVFLALIVRTIVLALFTPLISIITGLQEQT